MRKETIKGTENDADSNVVCLLISCLSTYGLSVWSLDVPPIFLGVITQLLPTGLHVVLASGCPLKSSAPPGASRLRRSCRGPGRPSSGSS